jgi:hypothetical protein
MKFDGKKGKWAIGAGAIAVAGLAYAATQITVNPPIGLNDGVSGDKPKMQRAGDGTLIVAYGDSPVGAGMVYDVKAGVERTARDIFVKTCKPDATKSCNVVSDWSTVVNVSNSAGLPSTGMFDWRGTLGAPTTYPGDIDKPNIKTSGDVVVLLPPLASSLLRSALFVTLSVTVVA